MRLSYCAAPLASALSACVLFATQTNAVADAITALERGDLSSAEQSLRAELRTQPNDIEALDVLGVVLDKQKKYAEADEIYRHAVGLPKAPPSLLNNYGNHLLATGKVTEARSVFLKVIALNPSQANAHIQLARISLEKKSGSEALSYLDALPTNPQESADVRLLRMQALYLLHRTQEGDAVLAEIAPSAKGDARLSFSLGTALASAKQYDKAEAFFSAALEGAPGNFEVLYNLGVAASHAGHNERAREVLQAALDQQPRNVDVLYDLAAVDVVLNHKDAAVESLARAAQLAPEHPDIQLLLANTTAELGYFGDAIEAWNRYLKLVPNDDGGRRERGFAETALGVNAKNGMADLEWFVRKHPNDPVGHYELGVAESTANSAEALAQFNRALILKPDFPAARLGRALLNYREGKPAAALPDLEFAAERQPSNATILDRLGQIYLALDRVPDAVRVLSKAAELAPRDPTTLMHLGRALLKAGQNQEASAVMARFRELGSNKSAFAHPAGLVDFLSLSPEEQYARYREGVERTVRNNPDNPEAQVEFLKLSLGDGKLDQAAAASRQIIALKPSLAVIANTSAALVSAEQYPLAKEFLEQAIALAGPSGDLPLDLAIATFHVVSAQAGLDQLGRIPDAQRTGDYYLARALMLEAAGKTADSIAAVSQARMKTPINPELYREAILLLIRDHRVPEASQLLHQAMRVLPDNPDILQIKATIPELAGKTEAAQRH